MMDVWSYAHNSYGVIVFMFVGKREQNYREGQTLEVFLLVSQTL